MDDCLKRQMFAASPAEPGDLPCGLGEAAGSRTGGGSSIAELEKSGGSTPAQASA
jgi:hypothetical protein